MDQLDLTLADVEHVSRFPIDDPTFPAFVGGHNSRGNAQARWQALGGPNRTATVTAGGGTKVYGAADPTIDATSNGFEAADGITVSATRAAGEESSR